MHTIPWLIPARYCARQDATALLELWALLLVFAGCALLTRSTSRVLSGAFLFFAAFTGVAGGSIFYGCSMTAASEQGMGTDLPSGTYTALRCIGYDALSRANGWILFATCCSAAIALLILAVVRWRGAARAFALTGSTVLFILTFVSGFLLLFVYSWCASNRLF